MLTKNIRGTSHTKRKKKASTWALEYSQRSLKKVHQIRCSRTRLTADRLRSHKIEGWVFRRQAGVHQRERITTKSNGAPEHPPDHTDHDAIDQVHRRSGKTLNYSLYIGGSRPAVPIAHDLRQFGLTKHEKETNIHISTSPCTDERWLKQTEGPNAQWRRLSAPKDFSTNHVDNYQRQNQPKQNQQQETGSA